MEGKSIFYNLLSKLTNTDRITKVDIQVFMLVSRLDKCKGCFASNEYIAKALNISTSRVSLAISKLLNLGFLTKLSFDGRVRTVKVNYELTENTTEGIRQTYSKQVGRLIQNQKSNIINNNESNKNNTISLSKDKEVRCSEEHLDKPTQKSSVKSSLSKTVDMPLVVREIIDFWKSSGLKEHRQGTKVLQTSVDIIKQLMKGTFFNSSIKKYSSVYKNRPFYKEDIVKAIKNFALAATSPDYSPPLGGYKTNLQKIAMPIFFYHGYKGRSYFIEYFEQPPKLLADCYKTIEDKYPNITEIFESFYADIKNVKSLLPREVNDLRRAAIKCYEYWQENRGDLFYTLARDVEKLAEEVCTALETELVQMRDFSMFTTGWFTSDTTWKIRVPKYLAVTEGLMTEQMPCEPRLTAEEVAELEEKEKQRIWQLNYDNYVEGVD